MVCFEFVEQYHVLWDMAEKFGLCVAELYRGNMVLPGY